MAYSSSTSVEGQSDSRYAGSVTILTFVRQLRQLTGVGILVHVRKVVLGLRRLRLEYRLVIWVCGAYSEVTPGRSQCYRIPYISCWRSMTTRVRFNVNRRKVSGCWKRDACEGASRFPLLCFRQSNRIES